MTGTLTSLGDIMSFLPWNCEQNCLSALKVFMWGVGSWWWEKLNNKPSKLSFKVSLKSGLHYINLGRSPNKNYDLHPMGWGPGIKENEDVKWMLTSFHSFYVSGCHIALTSPTVMNWIPSFFELPFFRCFYHNNEKSNIHNEKNQKMLISKNRFENRDNMYQQNLQNQHGRP